MKDVTIGQFVVGEGRPLLFFSGPCVIEGEEETVQAAAALQEIFGNTPWVFKSSYDKANRSSVNSYRGPGIAEGLRILARVKREFGVPIVTDVHTPEEVKEAAAVVDVVQIPAFLCRQTDLLVAAGETGCVVKVKKGQFLAPWDMRNVVDKILSTGNDKIILTDRGTTFGYNNLVSDMRAIPVMQGFGFPVCFDATHAVQLPGGAGETTGGQREFIPVLAKAAVAAGANSLFLEAHPHPEQAKSDAASQLSFAELKALLPILQKLHEAAQCSNETVSSLP